MCTNYKLNKKNIQYLHCSNYLIVIIVIMNKGLYNKQSFIQQTKFYITNEVLNNKQSFI